MRFDLTCSSFLINNFLIIIPINFLCLCWGVGWFFRFQFIGDGVLIPNSVVFVGFTMRVGYGNDITSAIILPLFIIWFNDKLDTFFCAHPFCIIRFSDGRNVIGVWPHVSFGILHGCLISVGLNDIADCKGHCHYNEQCSEDYEYHSYVSFLTIMCVFFCNRFNVTIYCI